MTSAGAIPALAAWGRCIDDWSRSGADHSSRHRSEVELNALWRGIDPAARVILASVLQLERAAREQPVVEELVVVAGFAASALSGVLAGAAGPPSFSIRDDPVMMRWMVDALVEDFAGVSDRYEVLTCDERCLVVADGDIGRSSILLMNRRDLEWSVALWPSQDDRTYVPPIAPGGFAGVREPRVPIAPAGHDHAAIDPAVDDEC